MTVNMPMSLNRDCFCRPVDRQTIIQKILEQNAAPNMEAMLASRLHYFANTSVFLSPSHLSEMLEQIQAIESVVKRPAYIDHVIARSPGLESSRNRPATQGVFMGYDFHISEEGPKLIEINSNAGGAFIVNMIEQSGGTSTGDFTAKIIEIFQSEWSNSGRSNKFRTLAIVDENPSEQYHYPDMCLAKSLFESRGIEVVITDPAHLRIENGALYHETLQIDVVYNRLTDFDLSAAKNQVVRQAYYDRAAVVTPAPHHHALYADKRNLISLSDPKTLESFGVSQPQMNSLKSIPKTRAVTREISDELWDSRKSLFFKPEAGFGSRGAFRGAKLTRKTWSEILQGGYIAQERIIPPLRAVTVDGEQKSLKFDVRVYTYDGAPLLFAARIYQGQTTNLRTAGGGLAAVLPIPIQCLEDVDLQSSLEACRLSA